MKIQVGIIYGTEHCGSIKVVEYFNSKKVKVKFLDTGYVRFTNSLAIRRGKVRDVLSPSVQGVGFLGIGDCTSKSQAYTNWYSMLTRCYGKKQHNSYKYCTVDPIWHNYQNFLTWHNDNYIFGYELDKDILIKGNKVYSPNTCIYVTKTDNLKERWS